MRELNCISPLYASHIFALTPFDSPDEGSKAYKGCCGIFRCRGCRNLRCRISRWRIFASLHWVEHTQSFETALSVLIRALFDQPNNLFNALRRPDTLWRSVDQNIGSQTGLQCAASQGLTQTLSDILPSSREEFVGAIDRMPAVGNRPLVSAAANGHESTVRLLLNSGANIEVYSTSKPRGTALFHAVARGAKAMVEVLLDYGAKAGTACEYHTNALQAGIFYGHLDIVKLLLGAGASPNADPGIFGAALATGASQGNEEMTVVLLEAGADPNQQDGEIGTALHWATVAGNVRVVQLLLNAGANLNPEGH